MGPAGLRRVEHRSRLRQRSWSQGVLFNSGILCGALELWVGLEAHWAFGFAVALRSVRLLCWPCSAGFLRWPCEAGLLRWPRSAENKEFYALAWTSRTAK